MENGGPVQGMADRFFLVISDVSRLDSVPFANKGRRLYVSQATAL